MTKEIVVIFDQLEEPLQFFVTTDARFLDLNDTYINGDTDDKSALLSELIYDPNGDKLVKMSREFPADAVRRGAPVVVCGFIP